MKRFVVLLALVVGLALGNCFGLSVDPAIAYSTTASTWSVQGWTGALGFAFQVNSQVGVNGFGVYDYNLDGTLASPITVSLWERSRIVWRIPWCSELARIASLRLVLSGSPLLQFFGWTPVITCWWETASMAANRT
jgi:hypothetical protein